MAIWHDDRCPICGAKTVIDNDAKQEVCTGPKQHRWEIGKRSNDKDCIYDDGKSKGAGE